MKLIQITDAQVAMIKEAQGLTIQLVERAAKEQGITAPQDLFHAGFSIAFGGMLAAYEDAHPDFTGCIPRCVGHVVGQIAGRIEDPLVRLQLIQQMLAAFNEGVETTSIIHDSQGSA